MGSHRAGFISLIGRPNVGKSSLLNLLLGEPLSIITPKAQTTRHRIRGIRSGEDYQLVFSDTPGILRPAYKLHEAMLQYVESALEDADIVALVVDGGEEDEFIAEWSDELNKLETNLLLVVNKIDVLGEEGASEVQAKWEKGLSFKEVVRTIALEGKGVERLMELFVAMVPEHEAFFDKEELTDRSERFYASEMIREAIFLNFKQEIPYASEVVVDEFKDEDLLRIRATIYVERSTQKGILIGKGGEAIKRTGTMARERLEGFFGKQVFLDLHVKVEANWRNKPWKINYFGYER